MPTNFRFNNGGTITDFSDVFIRRDLFSSGGLWGWGDNGYGQLGDNTLTSRSSPVQNIASGSNWKQVNNNYRYAAAIKTDGTLWTWGINSYGQLGDNSVAQKSSPVQTVTSGTNWKQVSVADHHAAAIKTDGTLWTWGYAEYGQLGDNTNGVAAQKSSPVQTIAGGTNWKQVSCNGNNTLSRTAAIKTDGTLWLWGSNFSGGALGDGTSGAGTDKSSPVQTVAGGTNWKQVSCGASHTGAIKTDGTLWIWGEGSNGKLGDNTTATRTSPVQTIAAGTNWKQVSCGYTHTSAIKADGTLWTWGYNSYGELGDNTTVRKSSPVQTVAGGTNWKQVSTNSWLTAAIKTDGTLWTWGDNTIWGALGDGTLAPKSSPVQTLAGGTNWKQVSIGGNATLAISEVFSGGYGPVTTLVEIYGSATWTVPSGVTSLDLVIVGAGGNGGSVTKTTAFEYSAGGGGGAGQYLRYTTYAVSPGQVLTVTIGVANGGAASGQGGTTTVTGGTGGTVSAVGGLTGTNGTNSVSGSGGDSGNGFAGAPPDSIDTGGGGGGATAVSTGGGSPGAGVTTTVAGTSFYLADGGGGLGVFGGNTTIGGGGNGASRLNVGTTPGQNGVYGAAIFAYVT